MKFNIKIDFPLHALKKHNKDVLREIKHFLEDETMESAVTIPTDWEDEEIKIVMEVLEGD